MADRGAPVLANPSEATGGLGRRRFNISRKILADLVAILDVLLVTTASVVAKYLYVDPFLGGMNRPDWLFVAIGLLGGIISHWSLSNQGLYDQETVLELEPWALRVWKGLGLAFLFLIGIAFIFKISEDYSRGWFVIWFLLSACAISAERALLLRWLRKLAATGIFDRKIAIFGAGALGRQLLDYFERCGLNVTIVGIYDGHDLPGPKLASSKHDLHLSGSIRDLIAYGRDNHLDKVVVALPASEENRILEAADALSVLPCDIHLCTDMLSLILQSRGATKIGALSLHDIHLKPISEWGHIQKVLFDFCIALLLLFLASPLLTLVAIAVKLSGPGPAIFRQRRRGYNGKIFEVLKFRTMTVIEDGAIVRQATKNDKRVTSVGRILRKTSLDELPQLWNVLKGEMSLVGPRPHPLKLDEEFELLRKYYHRNKVKPGITGLAQIKGYRGETDAPVKMEMRVKWDLEYINNWSIWLDLKILAMTTLAVVRGENAY